jgi:hypothetical protein
MRKQIVNVRIGQGKEINEDKDGLMMWKRMGRKIGMQWPEAGRNGP